MSLAEYVVCALVIAAVLLIVATTVALWRAPGALTRVNLLGPTVSLAIPLLIVANLLRDWSTTGFDPNNAVRGVLAIAGLWIIGSVGSFYMARSVYGVTLEQQADQQQQESEASPR
ncbi:Na+/H+ antiporter subunit G [Corynebacterium lowii]|uniref:Putative monovalent cation/H+ antiporter subunit G n=1 Tax=Corynebacterium lowii TaxID=1544413 RepID=A0A0Q1E3F9_9CORY|nr:Na+/H+ antiporter subunit G [Corynebacterium lowii]KQB87201.1 putative monovalent cation/H+ antiporter subunit G [Corynebacterium lowii]MDP9852212.1 multicomponent Na+:H+ antiporter subunit G [Corynebacterium lowii]